MMISRVPRNVSAWLINSCLVAILGPPPKDPHDDVGPLGKLPKSAARTLRTVGTQIQEGRTRTDPVAISAYRRRLDELEKSIMHELRWPESKLIAYFTNRKCMTFFRRGDCNPLI